MTVDLEPVRRMVAGEHGLATVAVVRADGTPHVSLVNAGVLDHPRSGQPVAAYVTYGRVKIRNLRERPRDARGGPGRRADHAAEGLRERLSSTRHRYVDLAAGTAGCRLRAG